LQNVSIIIPAYNEEDSVHILLDKVCNLEFVKQVIFVDDYSNDHTQQIARKVASEYNHVQILSHQENRGKTEAIKVSTEVASRYKTFYSIDTSIKFRWTLNI